MLHPYTRYAGVTCAGMLCCAFVAFTVQLYAQLYELVAVRVACGSCMLYPCIMYVGCLSLWAALLPVCRRVPCCDVPWHVFVLPYSLFLVLMAPLITHDYTQWVLLVPSNNASGM